MPKRNTTEWPKTLRNNQCCGGVEVYVDVSRHSIYESQHDMTLSSKWRSTKTKGGQKCLVRSIACIGSGNYVLFYWSGHTKTRTKKSITLEVVCD
jgi:hypothetical protein